MPSGLSELWISPTGSGLPSDPVNDWVLFDSLPFSFDGGSYWSAGYMTGVPNVGKFAIGRFFTDGQSSDWSATLLLT
jgi:hypothetical protein